MKTLSIESEEMIIVKESLNVFLDVYAEHFGDDSVAILYDVFNFDFSGLSEQIDSDKTKPLTLNPKDVLDIDFNNHIFKVTHNEENTQKIGLSKEWTKVSTMDGVSEFCATYNDEKVTIFIDDTII